MKTKCDAVLKRAFVTLTGLCAVVLSSCLTPVAAAPDTNGLSPTGENGSLLLGNPSDAGSDQNNLLLPREAHAMSYNAANGGPNWVSWHLDRKDMGPVDRSNFMPDPLLPPNLRIRHSDYTHSGYNRGHVCPSADRTRDKAYNQQTFVMSNMLPQTDELNQQVWADLEEYSRDLVRNGKQELYIIAGGAGSAGRIGSGKINVPTVCWKIIVVLPNGSNDLQRVNADTRVIAVSIPNRKREEIGGTPWSNWITTVDQLQKTTGYDFLSALPDNVERVLEMKRDSGLLDAPAAAQVRVWVNTASGVYHLPGAKYYGRTAQGEYMTEAQARAKGFRPAR